MVGCHVWNPSVYELTNERTDTHQQGEDEGKNDLGSLRRLIMEPIHSQSKAFHDRLEMTLQGFAPPGLVSCRRCLEVCSVPLGLTTVRHAISIESCKQDDPDLYTVSLPPSSEKQIGVAVRIDERNN